MNSSIIISKKKYNQRNYPFDILHLSLIIAQSSVAEMRKTFYRRKELNDYSKDWICILTINLNFFP